MKTRTKNGKHGGIILPLIALLLLIIFLGWLVYIIWEAIVRIVPRPPPDEQSPPIQLPTPRYGEEPPPGTIAIFTVERTTDLTNWYPVATIRGTNGQRLEWSDPDSGFVETNKMGFWRTRFEGFEEGQ